MKKLDDVIEDGMRTETFETGNKTIIKNSQDVEPIIDAASFVSNNMTKEEAHKKSMYKVGELPMTLASHMFKYDINILNNNEICLYIMGNPLLKKFRFYNGTLRKPKLPIALKKQIDKAVEDYARLN